MMCREGRGLGLTQTLEVHRNSLHAIRIYRIIKIKNTYENEESNELKTGDEDHNQVRRAIKKYSVAAC